MKTKNYILLIGLFLFANIIQAQETKDSKFKFIGTGGIGYGTMKSDNEVTYNLDVNIGQLLLNYKLNNTIGIATGVGWNELSGNGFNSEFQFYQERTLIKVPLLATFEHQISNKSCMVVNLGFYTQNIVKDEYTLANTTLEDIYSGWNFGAQFELGFVFNIFNDFSAGINYSSLYDLSKFNADNSQFTNNDQKFSLNTIGFIFTVAF